MIEAASDWAGYPMAWVAKEVQSARHEGFSSQGATVAVWNKA